MARMSSMTSRCLSLASLCLTIVPAILSSSAVAQGINAANGKVASDAGKKKEVKFEVISIRPRSSPVSGGNFGPTPDGFVTPLSVWGMIMLAYSPDDLITWMSGHGTVTVRNAPPWLYDQYDINARVSDDDREAWRNQGSKHELLNFALRNALKERCELVIHEQPTEVPDYKLVLMKNGPKLKATTPGSALPIGTKLPSGGIENGTWDGHKEVDNYWGATMGDLAMFLSRTTGRQVHDMTGLNGRYDFTLQMADQPSHDIDEMPYNYPIDHLRLELKSGKGPGLALVIDHIERPTAN